MAVAPAPAAWKAQLLIADLALGTARSLLASAPRSEAAAVLKAVEGLQSSLESIENAMNTRLNEDEDELEREAAALGVEVLSDDGEDRKEADGTKSSRHNFSEILPFANRDPDGLKPTVFSHHNTRENDAGSRAKVSKQTMNSKKMLHNASLSPSGFAKTLAGGKGAAPGDAAKPGGAAKKYARVQPSPRADEGDASPPKSAWAKLQKHVVSKPALMGMLESAMEVGDEEEEAPAEEDPAQAPLRDALHNRAGRISGAYVVPGGIRRKSLARQSITFKSKVKVMMLLKNIKLAAAATVDPDPPPARKRTTAGTHAGRGDAPFRTFRSYDPNDDDFGKRDPDGKGEKVAPALARASSAYWSLREALPGLANMYYNLPEVPELAVTPAGTLDHNQLTNDGYHSLEETSMALEIILNLPGVMRQQRWPQVLMLPHASFCQTWSLFIILLVLCQAVFVPVEAVFADVKIFEGAIEWISTSMFVFDFFLQFVLADTTEHGKVIVSGRVIAERYVKSKWFWLDLISCLPFDLILKDMGGSATKDISQNSGLIKALKLLRLFRLSKVIKKLERRTQGGVQFTKLLFGVLLSVHWIACGWKGIDDFWRCGDGNSYNWLSENPFELDERRHLDEIVNRRCKSAAFRIAYPNCLHQACLSVAGDGRAVTSREQYFFAVVFIYGSIMQATIFGKMAGLLHRLAEATQVYETKIFTISARLKHLGLDTELSERIMRYYEQLWDTQHMTSPNSLEFFKELTPRLQLDARLALYANMIRQIPFMRRISRSMMEHLIQSMRPEIFMESEAVMRRRDVGDWMIFIEQGTLAILDPASNDSAILKLLHPGDFIGERGLLENTPRNATVLSLTWTNVNRLTRADWERTRATFPEEAKTVQAALVNHDLGDTTRSEKHWDPKKRRDQGESADSLHAHGTHRAKSGDKSATVRGPFGRAAGGDAASGAWAPHRA